MSDPTPTLILSPGTRIVITKAVMNSNAEVAYPRGAVGVIVKSPIHVTYAYLVRMIDGVEVWLKRPEFEIHKHFQNPQKPDEEFDLYTCVQYRCIVVSRAYGLDTTNRGRSSNESKRGSSCSRRQCGHRRRTLFVKGSWGVFGVSIWIIFC